MLDSLMAHIIGGAAQTSNRKKSWRQQIWLKAKVEKLHLSEDAIFCHNNMWEVQILATNQIWANIRVLGGFDRN